MPAYKTADDLPHKGFLNTREAAEVLGIKRNTVCWYIRHKRLGAVRRRWYYGHETGRNLRVGYFIPFAEIQRFLMESVVRKYARPREWLPPKGAPDVIMGGTE